MELKNYFAQDNAGNVVQGATCSLYVKGTQTLVAGLVGVADAPMTNPFTSDANGLVQFKAPNGEYDLLIVSGIRRYTIQVQCLDVSDTIGTVNQIIEDGQNAAESYAIDILSHVTEVNTNRILAQQAAITATEAAATAQGEVVTLVGDLSDVNQGAKMVAFNNQMAPAFLKTTSDILNGIEVSVFSFMEKPTYESIRNFSGTFDAQPGIQMAIDVMNSHASGGSFHLPWGLFPVSNMVTVKSNVRIRGEGRSSIVRGNFSAPINRIFTTPHTVLQENITLENFVIDRRNSNSQHGALFGGVRGFVFKDMSIIGPTNPTVACGAIGFSPFDAFAQIQSEDVQVVNLYLEASNNFGVAFGNVNGGSIIGTRTRNCFREVIGLEAWGDGTVSAGNPLGTLGVVEGIVVANNAIRCTQDPAYHFGGSTGPVMLIGGATSGGIVRNCQIGDNNITVESPIAGSGFDGVALVGSLVQPLENINVTSMVVYGAPRHGVSIGSAGQITRNCSLSDIKIYNANAGGAASAGSAIRIGNATGIDVDNIRVRGTNHVYAIEEASGSNNNSFTNLLADAGTSGLVKLVGTTSKYSLSGGLQNRGGETITESVGVENGATYTFSPRGTNGRALYRIRGNFGLNDYAEFTVSSGTIATIYIGSDVRVAAINPDVNAALNIYLSGNQVTIKNRLGSARSFVLESIAP